MNVSAGSIDNELVNNSYDIKNTYNNIKKEDNTVNEYMNRDINSNSSMNVDNNEQVNISIENSNLNKKIYNCHTCNIQIYNYSFFRFHFKSEWHKYNLKRKLLNLNAVNELTFNEKVQNVKQDENLKDKKNNNDAHKKRSNNDNNKKKKGQKKNNIDLQINNNDSTEKNVNNCTSKSVYATKEDVLLQKNVIYDNPLVCFFDNRLFPSINENIKHMNDNYSFFIPDIKYVTNLKKVLLIIGKKIYEENICIYCFRNSKCVKSLQSHMVCKSHTKLHTDFFVFIQKYYDFSKTYVELLNKYISSKEDKQLLLQLLHDKEKKKKNKNITSCLINDKTDEKESYSVNTCILNEKKNNNTLVIMNNNVNDENKSMYLIDQVSGDTKNDINSVQACDTSDNHEVNDNGEQNNNSDHSDHSDNNDNNDNSDNNNNSDNSDNSDYYKIKEDELSKNINCNVIYEVLEQFGYIKPELTEYNNLLLPDGSEAINRKLAYIFKQKLPLVNKEASKCNKIDVLKKKEDCERYRKYKYYIDAFKKYNLSLNLKTNKLNKFYKSDSIFFL
ncbi:zinc finger protein, putative [Hepatocystis sp. ex Piliocolobus tephrosceles]|nr:zinc finger protein, putative [Hepatocystis sp. ex Piliocolobus tephrosceles]